MIECCTHSSENRAATAAQDGQWNMFYLTLKTNHRYRHHYRFAISVMIRIQGLFAMATALLISFCFFFFCVFHMHFKRETDTLRLPPQLTFNCTRSFTSWLIVRYIRLCFSCNRCVVRRPSADVRKVFVACLPSFTTHCCSFHFVALTRCDADSDSWAICPLNTLH